MGVGALQPPEGSLVCACIFPSEKWGWLRGGKFQLGGATVLLCSLCSPLAPVGTPAQPPLLLGCKWQAPTVGDLEG